MEYIGKTNRHITVKAGSVAIFEVPFKAYPTPSVTWKHGKESLPKGTRVQEEVISCLATLRLRDCQLTDAGEYPVTLKNEHGELTTSFRLTVLDKPDAPKDLSVTSVTEDSVSLSWLPPDNDGGSNIKGYVIERREASRRSWQKIGTTSSLTFTADCLVEGQSYLFQVKAENEFGLSEPVQISHAIAPAIQCGKYSYILLPVFLIC